MKDLTLADLCALVVDCKNRTPPEAAPGEEIAGLAIGTPHIVNGRIRLSDAKPVNRQVFDTWTARAVPQAGDIVLTREAPVGRVGRVEDGMRLCLGQRTMLLRPHEQRVDSRFLHYFLLSPYIQGLLHSQASGSTVAHLRVGQVRDLRIPAVPEVTEQRRIGAVLGALDDKIAVNERLAMTADALSHALFDGTFRSTAREDRAGWTPGHLSDICSTQYGYTASSSADPTVGPKFLRVKDINKRNWITWSDVPHCEINDQDFEKYRLNTGDVLVARMADPGKSALVEEATDAVFASYLVRLKTPSLAHSYFVWGFLKSDAYARYANSSRGGSVQANMNAKVIVGAPLVIPPPEAMEQYLRSVRPVRERLTLALRESTRLATLRDTLLPHLMSGRLRVMDAEKMVEDAT